MRKPAPPHVNYKQVFVVCWCVFVVVILILILIPVFATEGYPATKVVCASNLMQLSTATKLYVADNDDALPIYYSFDGRANHEKFYESIVIYAKINELLLCPKEQKDIKEGIAVAGQEGIPGKMDYAHCLSLRATIPNFSEGKRLLLLSSVKEPEKVPYLRDPIRGYGTAKDNKVPGFLSPHGGGFTTGFMDAHVKYMRNPNINTDL